MAKLPSDVYWRDRAEQRMDVYQREGAQALRVIGGAFQQATANLLRDMDRVFANYAKRQGLTPEAARAYLAQPAPHAEYERLLAQLPGVADPTLRQDLLARINAPAARYRMSRLEALQRNIAARVGQATDVQTRAATAAFQHVIQDAYGRAMFDIQRGTGLGFSFSGLSAGTTQEILRNPWSGANYSARIWNNQRALETFLERDLTAGLMAGRSSRRLAEDLVARMGVGYREAERLVRTETTYMANAAEMESCREAGIEWYRFLATLDSRTSKACRDLDGEPFKVSAAMPGENMPPLHPNCRSTTVADIGEEALAGMERRARDPATGELAKVPGDMRYPEWKRWVANGSPADVRGWRVRQSEGLQSASEGGIIAVESGRMVDGTKANMKRPEAFAPREPMPKEQLQKIQRAFERSGGVIQMDSDGDALLRFRGADGITLNEDIIILPSSGSASRAVVFEELIHTAQYRTGGNDGTALKRLECEIAAKEKVLRHARAYKLTREEIQDTEILLRRDRDALDEYLRQNEV